MSCSTTWDLKTIWVRFTNKRPISLKSHWHVDLKCTRLFYSSNCNSNNLVLWKYLSPTLTFCVPGAEMTKHHGRRHTGCQTGPHSWWHDTAWQVQSLLPDKALWTTCPMSCCQSDYTVFAWHGLVAKHDMKKRRCLSDQEGKRSLLSTLKSLLSANLSFLAVDVCLSFHHANLDEH